VTPVSTPPWKLAALLLLALTMGCTSAVRVAMKPHYVPMPLDSQQADVRLDIPYRLDDGADPAKHRLDLFLPPGNGWPMLVFVHGGSLEKGDTAQKVGGHDIYRNIGRFYAARGVGVALINYRLQPSVTWRGQVDDVATATAWLIEQVRELGGDGRFYVSGHSAGSWLAAQAILDDDVRERHALDRSDISGIISISGSGFDLTDEETWEMFGKRERWKRRFSDGPNDTAWKETASIIPLIDTDTPPFLLLYSSDEWPALVRQNQLFCTALKSVNAECEIEEIEGLGHKQMVLAMSQAEHPLSRRLLEELAPGEPAVEPFRRVVAALSQVGSGQTYHRP